MALTAYDILKSRLKPAAPTPAKPAGREINLVSGRSGPGHYIIGNELKGSGVFVDDGKKGDHYDDGVTYNHGATKPAKKPVAPKAPGGGGGGGSSAAANNAKAAANLGQIAGYNAQSTKDQYDRARENYDLADQQNTQLATEQRMQASGKGAADRFGQLKREQATAHSVLGAAGNAMQGSGLGSLISMLRDRNDLDNTEVLNTLRQNWDAILNSLSEAKNANVLNRNDAAATAEFGLRGIEADTAAQLGNIDPKLFVTPGTGAANLGSAGFAAARKTPAHIAESTGYFMPNPGSWESRAATQPNDGSYFQKLLNQYQRR